jgi:hypothetical protein
VRRETAGAYLKAAGIGVRPPGAWGRRPPAKPANEVTTGSGATKPANTVNPNPNTENLSTKGKTKAETAKPANENEVTTGFGVELSDSRPKAPERARSTSFCEPFRDAIELSLSRDRNAMAIWQDLVSESGFRGGYQTVKRFVRKLRRNPATAAARGDCYGPGRGSPSRLRHRPDGPRSADGQISTHTIVRADARQLTAGSAMLRLPLLGAASPGLRRGF